MMLVQVMLKTYPSVRAVFENRNILETAKRLLCASWRLYEMKLGIQSNSIRNVKEYTFVIGDYVVLKQKKQNKFSTAYEPSLYVIYKINGSTIPARSKMEERLAEILQNLNRQISVSRTYKRRRRILCEWGNVYEEPSGDEVPETAETDVAESSTTNTTENNDTCDSNRKTTMQKKDAKQTER